MVSVKDKISFQQMSITTADNFKKNLTEDEILELFCKLELTKCIELTDLEEKMFAVFINDNETIEVLEFKYGDNKDKILGSAFDDVD